MESTPKKRGTFAKTARRQLEISEAALELVDEAGYGDVTLATVARRMDVPLPTIQYHFPTRSHLLVAVHKLLGEKLASSALVGEPGSGSVMSISVAVRSVSELTIAHPNRLALSNYLRGEAGDKDHPAHEYFKETYARETEAFASVIRTLQANGVAHPDLDSEHVARQTIAAWNGLQLLWAVDPTFDFAAAAEEMVRHFTRQDIMEARQAVADLMQSM